MMTKLKKTTDLINVCLIFLSILIFSINTNAKISDSASIYVLKKLLKKVNTPKHKICHKYPPEVEEYTFDMRVSDPKDQYFNKLMHESCDRYSCRFSIFKDGTTKIEYLNNIVRGLESKPEEEFLDSVNKNSNEFKESLKEIIRTIEFTNQESRDIDNYVVFQSRLKIKSNGENNFDKTKMLGGIKN